MENKIDNKKEVELLEDSKWYDEYLNQNFFAIINSTDIKNEELVPAYVLKSPELIDYIHQFLEKSPKSVIVSENTINNFYIVTSEHLYDNSNLSKETMKKCHEIISMANNIKYDDNADSKIKGELLDRTVIENKIELKLASPKEFVDLLYESYCADYYLYQTLFQLETNKTFNIEYYRNLVLLKGTTLSVISLINNYKDVLTDDEREFVANLLNYKIFLEENYSNELVLDKYVIESTLEKIVLNYTDEELIYFLDEFDVKTINKVIDELYVHQHNESKFTSFLSKFRKRR